MNKWVEHYECLECGYVNISSYDVVDENENVYVGLTKGEGYVFEVECPLCGPMKKLRYMLTPVGCLRVAL